MAAVIGILVLLTLGALAWHMSSSSMKGIYRQTDAMGMTREQADIHFANARGSFRLKRSPRGTGRGQ